MHCMPHNFLVTCKRPKHKRGDTTQLRSFQWGIFASHLARGPGGRGGRESSRDRGFESRRNHGGLDRNHFLRIRTYTLMYVLYTKIIRFPQLFFLKCPMCAKRTTNKMEPNRRHRFVTENGNYLLHHSKRFLSSLLAIRSSSSMYVTD